MTVRWAVSPADLADDGVARRSRMLPPERDLWCRNHIAYVDSRAAIDDSASVRWNLTARSGSVHAHEDTADHGGDGGAPPLARSAQRSTVMSDAVAANVIATWACSVGWVR